ncbi:Branched-chain amino acid aminotransferase [hydrothermal vent metagenome]|uniref:Branched-chain amino acid aminotransferase n=1 Tax=hydrothermal vent metagenome TaxID=652676 RepID=A0A3B0R9S9_9ZZZZ
MSEWSQTWTWLNGSWHEGNTPIIGPRTHGFWLGSTVFDGARGFEGVAPDLDRHCERVNRSAVSMGLLARHETGEIMELAQEGLKKFAPGAAVYIRPMYWAEQGGFSAVPPMPESTRFALCLYEVPMPEPTGFSITHSSYRRPARDQAPVEAKAACLYPNSARAISEAKDKGFDNALVSDAVGNIAELATANVFLAKDGDVHTPAWNGTFLNGITRQRVIRLLGDAGVTIHERALGYQDFLDADEIFSTGNYSKVMPITRIDARELQPGPLFHQARDLYWEFAHSGK